MSRIKVNQIQVGQQLQADAISPKGRLLLTAGTKLDQKHLEILQTWGVVEVDVIGEEPTDEKSANFSDLPAEIKTQITGDLKNQFKNCNPGHSFIKELVSYQQTRMVLNYLQGQKVL